MTMNPKHCPFGTKPEYVIYISHTCSLNSLRSIWLNNWDHAYFFVPIKHIVHHQIGKSRVEIYARLPGINQNVNGIRLICFGLWDAQLSNGYDWHSAGDNIEKFLEIKKRFQKHGTFLLHLLFIISLLKKNDPWIFLTVFIIMKPSSRFLSLLFELSFLFSVFQL